MRKYFLFDTETGGLDAKTISLLSFFGLVLDQDLTPIDTIDLVIRPDDGIYHLDIEAMKVNRINILDHHEKTITECEAGKALQNFLFKHTAAISPRPFTLIPTGHNIGRLDIPMGERLVGFDNWDRSMSRRTLDTGTIAQFLMLQGILPETNNCSLRQLCEHYKIDYSGAHNAKSDVYITLEVLKAMVKERPAILCPPTSTL